jgi:hypothetical protein
MTKPNKYEHPHLFKGTRICEESSSSNPLAKQDAELVCVPVARLWRDVHGVEALGNSKLVLGDDAPKSVTIIVLESGYFYVTDPHDQVLAAWELWLNDASLSNIKALSN